MGPGNIVLLNGTSSAGKTTTARALQEIMEQPYVHVGVDQFLRGVPQRCFIVGNESAPPAYDYFLLLYRGASERMVTEVEGGQAVFGLGAFTGMRIGPAGIMLLAGMYRSIAALASAGVDVIVDDVLHDERVLRAAVDAFTDLSVLFVGLHLPREIAERREQERGDRGPGGATAFYDLVHAHAAYDLELDTSILSPQECALQIRDALQNGKAPQAFRRLRTRFAG
jgi:chloramphenicol 3-O phosphotransferase